MAFRQLHAALSLIDRGRTFHVYVRSVLPSSPRAYIRIGRTKKLVKCMTGEAEVKKWSFTGFLPSLSLFTWRRAERCFSLFDAYCCNSSTNSKALCKQIEANVCENWIKYWLMINAISLGNSIDAGGNNFPPSMKVIFMCGLIRCLSFSLEGQKYNKFVVQTINQRKFHD